MRSWLLIPALLLAASCDRSTDDIPQADVAPDVVGQEVAPPDCHPSQRDLEGKCCPAGQFYAFATAQCLAIGPLECAAVLPASPESCVPRWCADWRDDDGVACPSGDDNCLPVGRTCTATELASGGGCPAGQWPSPPTGACVPAQAAPPAAAPPAPPGGAAPAGTPALVNLEKLPDTRFCAGAKGVIICPPGDSPCGPGRMPGAHGGCIDVGVPWTCPIGFVPDPSRKPIPDTPTPCVPDPAACSETPWGGQAPDADAVHVHATAPGGGNGSAAAPFNSLGTALAAAKVGATLALHPGDYNGPFTIDKIVTLRGYCAAKVNLKSKTGKAVLTVAINGTSAPVALHSMSIGGGVPGLWVDGGKVSCRALNIRSAVRYGVRVVGGSLQLQDSQIRNTLPQGLSDGLGVYASSGGRVHLRGVRVHHSRRAGVMLKGEGSGLVAEGLLVDGTVPWGVTNEPLGYGIVAFGGTTVDLTSTRLTLNHDIGLMALTAKTLKARGLIIDHNQPKPNGYSGFGMALFDGVQAQLRGVRINSNRAIGIDLDGAATRMEAWGLIIDNTLPQASDYRRGDGLEVTTAGRVTLHSARLSGNRAAAMRIDSANSTVEIDGVLIDDTRPDLAVQTAGHGIILAAGAIVRGSGLRASENNHAAVVAIGKKTLLEVSDVLIDGTRSLAGDGQEGYGIFVADTAIARLERVRVSGNHGAGVVVAGPGSLLTARALAIDHTSGSQISKAGGHGLIVTDGARARIFGAHLKANRIAGAAVLGKGSRLDLVGVLVEGTLAGEIKAVGGVGVSADKDTSVTVSGSRVLGNRFVGVVVDRAVDPVRVVGTRVETTSPAADDVALDLGTGISLNKGSAKAELISCQVVANHAAGILVTEARVRIEGCVVVDTQPALISADVEFSDGIVGHNCPSLAILFTLVHQHLRAGLLLDGNKSATIKHTQVSKGTYGLVTQGAGAVSLESSLLVDNDNNLVGDKVLFVPPAPDVAGF